MISKVKKRAFYRSEKRILNSHVLGEAILLTSSDKPNSANNETAAWHVITRTSPLECNLTSETGIYNNYDYRDVLPLIYCVVGSEKVPTLGRKNKSFLRGQI